MKLLLAILTLPLLVACSDTPEEAKRREAGAGSFAKQATYGDCDLGEMTWQTGHGGLSDQAWARVVICKGQQSTSLEYSSGKSTTSTLIVGTTAAELIVQAEELKKAAELKAKQEAAMAKLTIEERKLLNLN